MKGLRITYDDAFKAVNTLAITFALPNKSEPEAIAKLWVDHMDGIEPGELKRAVEKYIRDGGRFFPRVKDIRALAMEYRSRVIAAKGEQRPKDWNQTLDGPCPVCGARIRNLTAAEQGLPETRPNGTPFPPRLGVLHDEQRHRRANVPIVGYSTANVRQGAA